MRRCGLRLALLHIHSLLMLPSLSSAAIPIHSSRTMASHSHSQPQSQKKALRTQVRKALRALTPDQRAQQDSAIQSTILNSSWFHSTHRLCAYISCPALREVDTSLILSHILSSSSSNSSLSGQVVTSSKELYVPRVEDKNSNMRMLNITTMDDLVPNSMNILEPSSVDSNGVHRPDVMSATDPIDLFLLPGLAFDKQGRRLGRGGGYYDVLLKRYQDYALENKWNKPLLVALAYSEQIMEEDIIPVTPTDMPIDAIVSSDGVTLISALAKEKMF